MISSLDGVGGVMESVGREIERGDERATYISDDNLNVMCTMSHRLSDPRARHVNGSRSSSRFTQMKPFVSVLPDPHLTM
jgi:hypothetical protein